MKKFNDLFKFVYKKDYNVFFSPHSISQALSSLLPFAENETKKELTEYFGDLDYAKTYD